YKMLEEANELRETSFRILDKYKLVEIKYPIVVKSPFLFSGIGNIKINSDDEFKANKKKILKWLDQGPIIAEEYVQREFDFGVSIDTDIKTEFNYYENIIDKHFQYKGSYFNPTSKHCEFRDKIAIIKRHYESLGIEGAWSIDGFKAVDGRVIFHEVNARKSMGWFFCRLNELFNPLKKHSIFRLFNTKKIKNFNSLNEVQELFNKQEILLSPMGNKFLSVFLVGNSREGLDKRIKELEIHLFN
ncbi:ATP-grasp domain-containing protein, partial [Bacteriovoracaceae bacterium]|nr:ATP-grasp domain-containing protein [Bacteriovoracaceae bacterium]